MTSRPVEDLMQDYEDDEVGMIGGYIGPAREWMRDSWAEDAWDETEREQGRGRG